MGTGADFEIHLWRGDAHLAKENVGQLFIVVLAGMNEDGFDFRMALHLTHERGDFRKVGTRTDDIQDFQSLGHGVLVSIARREYSIGEMTVQCTESPFAPRKH